MVLHICATSLPQPEQGKCHVAAFRSASTFPTAGCSSTVANDLTAMEGLRLSVTPAWEKLELRSAPALAANGPSDAVPDGDAWRPGRIAFDRRRHSTILGGCHDEDGFVCGAAERQLEAGFRPGMQLDVHPSGIDDGVPGAAPQAERYERDPLASAHRTLEARPGPRSEQQASAENLRLVRDARHGPRFAAMNMPFGRSTVPPIFCDRVQP